MDWDCDNAILAEGDMKNVLSFEPRSTTVVRLLTTDKVRHFAVRYVFMQFDTCSVAESH